MDIYLLKSYKDQNEIIDLNNNLYLEKKTLDFLTEI